jgi:hypothetical protein
VGRLALLASGLALAGCQSAAEQQQALAEAQRASCLESGFVEGSDAFRLCLLLQDTNERIARLERRIDLLDSELSRVWTWGTLRRWP